MSVEELSFPPLFFMQSVIEKKGEEGMGERSEMEIFKRDAKTYEKSCFWSV